MQRISKAQETYLASLKRQLGEPVEYSEIRKLYTPEASRQIDLLLSRIADKTVLA